MQPIAACAPAFPSPDAPGALAVTDGCTTVGHIVEHDGSYFAFRVDGTLIGAYPTLTQASRALPPVNTVSLSPTHPHAAKSEPRRSMNDDTPSTKG